MASIAEGIRSMVDNLQTFSTLVWKRRFKPCFYSVEWRASKRRQDFRSVFGLNLYQSEPRRCRRLKKTENNRSVKRAAVPIQKFTRLSVIPPWLLRCPYRQETCTTRRKVEHSLGVLRDAFQDQVFWWTKPMRVIAREIVLSIVEWFLLYLQKRTGSNLGNTIKNCINSAMKWNVFFEDWSVFDALLHDTTNSIKHI